MVGPNRPTFKKTSFALFSVFGAAILLSSCAPKTPEPVPPPKPQVWGKFGYQPGEFKGPRAITADEKYIYVADRASRVSKWTKDGKYVMRWTVPVSRNGSFEGPEGIAILKNGEVAITNTHASRVLIYSKDGKLKRTFGSYGEGKGKFLLVTGICVDSDNNIYCADYGGAFDRISKWTPEGKLLATWSGHGEAKRSFRRPCGLAISKNGDLLVADIGNHRIQILDRNTGAYKGQFPTRGRKDGEVTYPYGVAVDAVGDIYTVEYGTHRVQKWTPEGKWIATWGGPGREPGQLANPWGLCVDPDGTVYVADTNNDRVQKFRFNEVAPVEQ